MPEVGQQQDGGLGGQLSQLMAGSALGGADAALVGGVDDLLFDLGQRLYPHEVRNRSQRVSLDEGAPGLAVQTAFEGSGDVGEERDR